MVRTTVTHRVRLCNSMLLCIHSSFALHNIRNCSPFCFWELSFSLWRRKALRLPPPDSLSMVCIVAGIYSYFPECLQLLALCPPYFMKFTQKTGLPILLRTGERRLPCREQKRACRVLVGLWQRVNRNSYF